MEVENNNCVICGRLLDIKTVVIVKLRGILKLIESSIARDDGKADHFKDRVKIKLHKACRDFYTSPKYIEALQKRKKKKLSQQSISECEFDLENKCLFCDEDVKDASSIKNSIGQVLSLETQDMQDSILKACTTHDDDWSSQVITRIDKVNILEKNATYHYSCYSEFCTPPGVKRERPQSHASGFAMDQDFEFIEVTKMEINDMITEDIHSTNSENAVMQTEGVLSTNTKYTVVKTEDVPITNTKKPVVQTEDVPSTSTKNAVVHTEDVPSTNTKYTVVKTEDVLSTNTKYSVVQTEAVPSTSTKNAVVQTEDIPITNTKNIVMQIEDVPSTNTENAVLESCNLITGTEASDKKTKAIPSDMKTKDVPSEIKIKDVSITNTENAVMQTEDEQSTDNAVFESGSLPVAVMGASSMETEDTLSTSTEKTAKLTDTFKETTKTNKNKFINNLQNKCIAMNVTEICREEKRANKLAMPLADFEARAAHYIGCPKTYINELVDNIKITNAIEINTNVRDIISKIMLKFYREKVTPNLRDIFIEVKREAHIDQKYFLAIMAVLEYDYVKTADDVFLIVENPKLRFQRFNYLKKTLKFEGQNIYYIDERIIDEKLTNNLKTVNFTNWKCNESDVYFQLISRRGCEQSLLCFKASEEDFFKWVAYFLLPILKPSSLIVMQESPLHIRPKRTTITRYHTKQDMLKWLNTHDVPFHDTMHKAELFEIIEKYSNRATNEYVIDQLFKSYGHNVLYLPKNYHDLSPAHLLWDALKRNNIDFGDCGSLQKSIAEMISFVSEKRWHEIYNTIDTKTNTLYLNNCVVEDALDNYEVNFDVSLLEKRYCHHVNIIDNTDLG